MTRQRLSKFHEKNATHSIGQEVAVCGFVKSIRSQKTFSFVAINDGSCLADFQIVIDASLEGYDDIIAKIQTGASIRAIGTLVESPAAEQAVELKATDVVVYGESASDYPLQKKRHSFEFLRTLSHLRARTNTQGAVARVRSTLAYATHQFFQDNGYIYVPTPILTSSDCEGAGELFQVTTLNLASVPKINEEVDYSQDFFKKPAFLTVSGQLNAESYACGLKDVYTFGPTFRAENSNTARHLAEFWMIEPELAFADMSDAISLAERYVQSCLRAVLERNSSDIEFFDKRIKPGLVAQLKQAAYEKFEVITYTDAIGILKASKKAFEYPVHLEADLQTEHERYLCEQHFKKPVFVTNYPKSIKAFYMRDNDDNSTVAAFDLLMPGIGELIGGSQREDRYELLKTKMQQSGLDLKEYEWYLDLRKYGTVPHAGFGLGFERLIQYATGMENIRDVNAFPRYPGHCD